MKLTQKRLKEFLDYDPETGIFVWRVARRDKKRRGTIAGCLDKATGYWVIKVAGETYRAHRLAFLWMDGYLPENIIDHKDRIRINNKWDNLREASRSCNMRNRNTFRTNKSGVTGVSWNSAREQWRAYIAIPKQMHLGLFNYFMDAVKARWDAEVKYNFPGCNTTSSAYTYLCARAECTQVIMKRKARKI